MNRPRIFLSAVTDELRTARQAVAVTMRTLGFDPVSQDDFPTGHGELRQWLREQINSCEGLVQLVGQGYGAEPPEIDADYGRVSYTQFEFLYARLQGKKTWVIVAGDHCHRDKPPAQLDLPRHPAHPDPAAYQTERRQLQQAYLERLRTENHLRHYAADDTVLENVVLRLRDELGELRRRAERQQSRLVAAIVALFLALLLLGGGGWWAYTRLHTGVQQSTIVNTAKIRAHLLQTADETHRRELAEAEKSADWKQRQRLRDAAEAAHTGRLSRIDELAASFAEIEGRGAATNVLQEMTRILSGQGVDDAVAYVASQRTDILQTVRARAVSSGDRNRADLEPLLKAAALHESKGQPAEARALLTDILATEPDWPAALRAGVWFFIRQGDDARIHTTQEDSRRHYEAAHRLALDLTRQDPANTAWQSDLAVSFVNLGDVAVTQGRLDDAADAYGESLAIAKMLTAKDPRSGDLQRNLASSHDKMGNVAVAQGRLDEAARAYGESLAIGKALVAIDPRNVEWQSDLSISHSKLGNVAVAQDRLDDAARAYGESLAISKALAAADPGNAGWQRSISVSHFKLGTVALAQGRLDDASRAYRDSLTIAESQAAKDPDNSDWQRDVSVTYIKLADVALEQARLNDAAKAYGESLAIAKKLVARDPGNVTWQRDLFASYWKLANLAERMNQPTDADRYWRKAFDTLSDIDKRGLHLSPDDRRILKELREQFSSAP